jgi:hypothetical protein
MSSSQKLILIVESRLGHRVYSKALEGVVGRVPEQEGFNVGELVGLGRTSWADIGVRTDI